jgi:amino acid transporter/mannitol/fructose-specific phosphotransferase system IIA component (Ntr-type)
METKRDLKKGLGLVHVFAIAAGAMIGSGLFILPGMAHALAGPGVIWSYILAGVLATTGALSMAELVTAMPRAGSNYFYIMRGFGASAGSIAGVLSWFAIALKSSFAIVGMATFIGLVAELHGLVTGAVLTVIFMVLNMVGVREAARAQVIIVFSLLALLVLYVAVGIPRMHVELLVPFAPHGIGPVFATAGFVFVSYGGLLTVASMAEEVRNPGRVMPLGMMLALIFVTLLYAATVMVTSGILETPILDDSLTPISDGGRAIMGQTGFVIMSIGAILAFVSTANGGLMTASRFLLALSRDRMAPRSLSKINDRFQTPHIAIGATGGVILLSLLLPLEILIEAASCVLILTYMASCLAVIVLRESGLTNYRPLFRSPLYPWMQIAGILGLGFVLVGLGIEAYAISAVLMLAAFLVFWIFGRKEGRQESALLHLIERLTDRRLVTGTLEAELKQIIKERDEIVWDRFDRLAEAAVVLDEDQPMSRDDFINMAADRLAPRLELSSERLAEQLRQREDENSTLLSSTLAVPHIVVEGEGRFEMLIARMRGGVRFSEDAPAVTTIFVLAATRDERNFHLRALAAIAQVVQADGFEKRWAEAKGEQELRDVILLAERGRAG